MEVLRTRAPLGFFKRAAPNYDRAAVLAREVSARMAARLDYIKRAPSAIVDLGCGTWADEAALRARYPDARLLGVDASWPMLKAATQEAVGWRGWFKRDKGAPRVCALAQCLPLKPASIDMVWSNFLLHHLPEPTDVFREVHRVLSVEGLFMFSCLGPDTLKELRAVAPERVHPFVDMHDLGDALVAAGFAEPVMDMETITLTYASFDQLVADLRHTGSCNALEMRTRGLSGKSLLASLAAGYERFREAGRLPATFEIIYGHAWKPQPRKTAEGHAIVRFERR
ncbi:MAG: hypothetical protein RIR70_1723 [Pseudomonadota bacterium]|jgi:malonyl-CoA O-methyltransferase